MKSITEILPNTYRFNNERFYGERVGRYLIELPEQVVLIEVPRWRAHSAEFVREFRKPIVCIATHGSTVIADAQLWQRELSTTVILHAHDKNHPWIAGNPDRLFTEPRIQVGRLEVIHTPGHSHGSVCILDPETKALFTGDTLAGDARGRLRDPHLPDSHDEDGEARLRSVTSLVALDFESILPFHYHHIIGGARRLLEEAISSRLECRSHHTIT